MGLRLGASGHLRGACRRGRVSCIHAWGEDSDDGGKTALHTQAPAGWATSEGRSSTKWLGVVPPHRQANALPPELVSPVRRGKGPAPGRTLDSWPTNVLSPPQSWLPRTQGGQRDQARHSGEDPADLSARSWHLVSSAVARAVGSQLVKACAPEWLQPVGPSSSSALPPPPGPSSSPSRTTAPRRPVSTTPASVLSLVASPRPVA